MLYDTHFAIFESKYEDVCLQNYYLHIPGDNMFLAYMPQHPSPPTSFL